MRDYKFYFLGKIAALIGKYFNLKTEGFDSSELPEPPYIVISNHVSNLDPVFVNLAFDKLISFVASDSIFRSSLNRFVFSFLNIIPITKGIPDAGTLRGLFAAKKQKRIVAVFAEGQATWDGVSLPISSGTIRMLLGLKLPIVVVNICGAFVAAGRWRSKARRGNVVIKKRAIIDSAEILNTTEEKLQEKLKALLHHDEWKWQNKNKIPIRGPRAEYIERVFYLCPVCHRDKTIFSHIHRLTCKSCGFTAYIDAYGFISSRDNDFKTMHDWTMWQREYLKDFIRTKINSGVGSLLTAEECFMDKGPIRRIPANKQAGMLELKPHSLCFKNKKEGICFEIKKIRGLNVQKNEKLEFIFNNSLYKIRFKDKRSSALKWYDAISILEGDVL